VNQFEPPDRVSRGDQPRLPAAPGPGNDQPSFLSMVRLVAVIVALVILVFFGIGYAFGRVFL
jgi:hypothetical protein